MQSGWTIALEQLLHSPTFPMWVTLAAAGFFALVLFITLIRAEKTVANGALSVITFLAVGIAAAATVRKSGPLDDAADAGEGRPIAQIASVPALSCLDGLAGEGVEGPCERSLFASADIAAAAVSYTAAQLARLAPLDRPAAQSPEQQALRKALERDRYGLVAQVLSARDHCTENDCKSFELFAEPAQIKANMRDHVYDATVGRYALAWATAAGTTPMTAAATPQAGGPALAGTPPASQPTGKPNPIDFPTSASIPPVSIMTAEPPPMPTAPAAAPKQAQTPPPPMPVARPPAPKKQASTTPPAKRPASIVPPVQTAPPAASAASDDN